MPQLSLNPWFFYFTFSWLTLLFLAPHKVLKHINLNNPKSKTLKTLFLAWTWPW